MHERSVTQTKEDPTRSRNQQTISKGKGKKKAEASLKRGKSAPRPPHINQMAGTGKKLEKV